MIISTDVLHCIVCSEEYGGFTTGSSGWIWCWSSHRSAQQKRWAALPEEADGDAVSVRHASQSNRLQVGRHKPDWNKSDWMTCETGFFILKCKQQSLNHGKEAHCMYLYDQTKRWCIKGCNCGGCVSSLFRSLALLLREVMAGSVMLPTMDFIADPVSRTGFMFVFKKLQ